MDKTIKQDLRESVKTIASAFESEKGSLTPEEQIVFSKAVALLAELSEVPTRKVAVLDVAISTALTIINAPSEVVDVLISELISTTRGIIILQKVLKVRATNGSSDIH